MPRIIGIEIPGNKYVEYALRYLYGIGPVKALEIVERQRPHSRNDFRDHCHSSERYPR